MDYLKAASETVLSALQARRIGTPVSVRIVACGSFDSDGAEPLLGRALQAACDWLHAEVRWVAALGDVKSGHVDTVTGFRQGQTAVVSVAPRGSSQPLLEVVVVGNRGVLSWEPGPAIFPEREAPAKPLPPAARRLLDAVRRSLGSNGPVTLAGDVSQAGDLPKVKRASSAAGKKQQPQSKLIRTKPPYGVLLVAGAHTHQENYAGAFAADQRCRLVGVTDEPNVSRRRKSLNEKLARSLGIPFLPDVDAALARNDVHVVSICAEPERRAKVIVRCARAGKHLYLDKPMAASVDQAEEVAAAIGKSGVVSQMFSSVRSPAAARLRQLVDSGRLGELKAIHFDLTFAKGPAGSVPIHKPRVEHKVPRSFETVDSKRELYNVGVYPLVLLHWLLGRRVLRVCATTANYFFAEHRRNDVEDYAVVLMELQGGTRATLAVGRTGWRSHPMGGMNRTCVIGSRGAASVDAYRPRCEVWADELPWLPPRLHPQDPMGFWKSTFEEVEAAPKEAWLTPPGPGTSDVAYFLDCIERGRQSDVSAEVGAAVMKVLMAAYRSAAVGRFVAPEE